MYAHILGLLLVLTLGWHQATAQTNRGSQTPARFTNVDEAFDPLKYPAKAIVKGIEGTVKAEVSISEAGEYLTHNIVSTPDEILSLQVEKCLPSLTCEPAMEGDTAVESVKVLEVHFRIIKKFPAKTEVTFTFEG
ncbi:energy transducer TonB [Pontibacter sp. G13]|uniref:energy transducer TonB n=1 Tax=Pontibacter sp. G13 TaxID=3074898 RepID=UPI00288A2C9C|nr:energy transducer TonB [Pontibacter sp. G13]WNJ17445.1 energy transducer TonB [Pontibacter sp. G13]